MGDHISDVEAALDEAGRSCLRLIVNRSLTPAQSKKLAKWMFGCMNQRYTIRDRVRSRGPGELKKVLKFVATAWEDLQVIDEATNE